MLFNSIDFLFFFPLVCLLYFLIPSKYRWVLLLVSSYCFYMSWKIEYIGLILFSTLIDFIAAKKIELSSSYTIRKIYLVASLVLNLGILFFFKYYNFFIEGVNSTLGIGYSFHELILPVGISFYTFQSMSYTIDVYNRNVKAEKNLGIFALYVSFFPQLVAGPIERSSHLLPQFYMKPTFSYDRVVSGLRLMLWGFFKKIVIADRLALFVNAVYGDPTNYYGLTVVFATLFFAIQIYCDFSGYSDIAIGAARVLGFDLMKNFKAPYLSTSLREFWSAWHISLSTWFRDYVYIPLGGSKVKENKVYFNLFITFLISGLWHGADWTFIYWGVLHGAFIVLERYLSKIFKFSFWPLKWLAVFSFICFSWVFFRSNSIQDAYILLTNATLIDLGAQIQNVLLLSKGFAGLSISIVLVLVLFASDYIEKTKGLESMFLTCKAPYRWMVYISLIWMIYLLGEFNQAQFIYFQF